MKPCYNLIDPLATLEKLVLEDLKSLEKFHQENSAHNKVERLREFVKEFNAFKADLGLNNQWIEEAYYSNLEEEFVPTVARMCKIKNFLPLPESKENSEDLFTFSELRPVKKSVELNFIYKETI
jgi:hypothetical protein